MAGPASRRAQRALEARPRKGELREQAILDGTEELLAAKAWADVTTDDIAKAASLSGASSLYFYFESKDAVLLGLLERVHVELMAPVDAQRDELPFGRWIEGAAEHAVATWRKHRALLRTFFEVGMSDTPFAERWREGIQETVDAVAARIRREQRDGTLPASDVSAERLAISLVWMTQQSLYELFRRRHTRREEQELVATLATLWSRGVGHTSA